MACETSQPRSPDHIRCTPAARIIVFLFGERELKAVQRAAETPAKKKADAADGAGAETDQRAGRIVGVAREVALQPAVLSRAGEAVVRKGEMIETDTDVAG
jgi:hypothetical protein